MVSAPLLLVEPVPLLLLVEPARTSEARPSRVETTRNTTTSATTAVRPVIANTVMSPMVSTRPSPSGSSRLNQQKGGRLESAQPAKRGDDPKPLLLVEPARTSAARPSRVETTPQHNNVPDHNSPASDCEHRCVTNGFDTPLA